MTSPRRSLLFVPGSRPDRFEKAFTAGADVVCLDLEDAVAPPDKDRARATVIELLAGPAPAPELWVRINALESRAGLVDLADFADPGVPPVTLMLPKVRTARELELADCVLAERGDQASRLVPLIETARALRDIEAIAAAPRVTALLLGAVDLSAELRCALAWEPLLAARALLVAAAGPRGLDLIDAPFTDLEDTVRLHEETVRARAMGFTGRACIHPRQVAVANDAYTPSAAEIAEAEAVIAALEAAGGAAAQQDGKLIEKPVALAARRILDRAEGL